MVEILLILIYITIAAALAATAWAVFRTFRIIGKTSGRTHGIPVRIINCVVVLCTIIVMALSFIIGSTEPLHINTLVYSDTFWLRMSNMFVFTGVTAIIAGACAMAYSYYIMLRK